jgi:carboxypeptidase C (cathepsin A)
MKMSLKPAAVLLATALVGAAPAPHKAPPLPRAVPDAVTHHVAHVNGQSIPYTAHAGTISLKNDKEELTARMFYVSYTKDGAGRAHRPVTFFYNGGPGSSTIWLHMASFGPVKVLTTNGSATPPAPYSVVDNQNSLIDKTDLVFIDAPNTGYSRVLGVGKPADFMGVDEDGRAFTQFIQRYLSQYNRWNSPKFLFGESYGTTRDCVVVNMLQNAGVQMNGVVMLSSILNFQLGTLGGGSPIASGDWAYVLYLPTEAATAYYHHKAVTRGQNLTTFLKNVERFASGEYLHALAQGTDLNAAESDRVVNQLHDYLGLSTQYLRDANMRVTYRRFQKELLRNEGEVTGRLDSRFTDFDIDGVAQDAQWDPADVAMSSAIVSAFNQYVRESLHYNSDLQYRATAYRQLGAPWSFKHLGNDPPANVAVDLSLAMSQNPHLKVFNGGGYYDFATPYYAAAYTLQHLNIAPRLQRNITYGTYPSGHMVYINPVVQTRFKSEVARWYDTALH